MIRATDISDKDILNQINATAHKKTGLLRILIMFAISALLFVGAGFISIKIEQLIIFVIVLFVHESGHFVSMKAYGYSDVKIFFLPFLGAATSGNERNPNAAEEANVALSGPVPGIFIGTALTILYSISGREIYQDFAMWFLFLNGFNLLPFYPLDGGRFLNAVIFSRNYVFELIFIIGTSIVLSIVALSVKAYLLLFIPFIMLASLRSCYYSSKAAKIIKNDLSKGRISSFELNEDTIKLIREKLDVNTFAAQGLRKLKYMSFMIHDTWRRASLIPPKIAATIFLILIYFSVSFLGLISVVGLSALEAKRNTRYALSSVTNKENQVINAEEIYFKNKIKQKTELDQEFKYHGKREVYSLNGTLESAGYFYHGVVDGEWVNHRKNEILKFDKGKLISFKRLKDGAWIETSAEKLPEFYRMAIERWVKNQKPNTKLLPAH